MKFNLLQESFGQESLKGELNDLKSWVKSFTSRTWNPFGSVPDLKDLKLLHSNLPKNVFTHSGLIYYLHACWAKELGCVLRPDMIYYTILCEIATCVVKNPKDFKKLFTDQNKKQTIDVINMDADRGELNINGLCREIRKKIVSKELYQLVCDIQFTTDDPGAHEARCMTFCQMGIPYFDYMTSNCGIKSVDVQGQLADWKTLFDTVGRLKRLLSGCDSSGQMNKFLGNTFNTISTIIHHTFDNQFPVDPMYPSADTFFNDIFHYGNNRQCGSGHDEQIVSGWARKFYMTSGEDLHNFGASMAYVPYENHETRRKFVQVCTLAYSELVNDTAVPHYGKIMFEVLSEEMFNKIAMKDNGGSDKFVFDDD